METESLLREVLDALIEIDDFHAKNDTNSMIRKTNECITKIKAHFGEVKDE